MATCEADWIVSASPRRDTGRRAIAARRASVTALPGIRLRASAATWSIVSKSSGIPSARVADVKRSEERRVGKESRDRRWWYREKKRIQNGDAYDPGSAILSVVT